MSALGWQFSSCTVSLCVLVGMMRKRRQTTKWLEALCYILSWLCVVVHWTCDPMNHPVTTLLYITVIVICCTSQYLLCWESKFELCNHHLNSTDLLLLCLERHFYNCHVNWLFVICTKCSPRDVCVKLLSVHHLIHSTGWCNSGVLVFFAFHLSYAVA